MDKTAKDSRALSSRNSLLNSLIVPFVLIFILMIGLCFAGYRYAYNAANESAIDAQRVTLSGAAAQLDNALYTINTLTASINASKLLAEQIDRSIQTGYAYHAHEITKSLPSLLTDNSLIGYYFLYIKANGQLYARNQGLLSPEIYYGKFFGAADLTYDQWRDALQLQTNYNRVQPARDVLINGKRENTLTYNLPYISAYSSRNLGSFTFYIRTNGVRELFEAPISFGARLVYLTGSNGELLACFTDDPEIEANPAEYILTGEAARNESATKNVGGHRLLYNRTTLQNCDVSITIVTPVAVFARHTMLSLSVMIVVVFCGMIAMALIMARYIQSVRTPLKSLSENLNRSGYAGKGSFLHLSEAFLRMTDSNAHLNTRISQYREALFESIISERHVNTQVYSLLTEDGDALFNGEAICYRGIYMHTTAAENIPEAEQLKAIQAEIARCPIYLKLMSKRDEQVYALLYMAQSKQEHILLEQLTLLKRALQSHHGISARFYIGALSTSIKRVCYSFSQAWRRFEENDSEGEILVLVTNPTREDSYSLRDVDERALRALCAEGDCDGISRLLDIIYHRNFEELKLSGFMQSLLCARLADVLISLAETPITPDDTVYFAGLSPEEAFAWLREQFCAAALAGSEKYARETRELNNQIIEYIRQNFRDPNICLASIASVFGMTESYLSVLIKLTLNEHYTTYLNRLRVEYANQLLQSQRFSIDKIASMCGYTNAATFRRAYKRVMGYSPSAHHAQANKA